MTRNLRVISKIQEKDFENECQEGITAQKSITQFWGCYKPSPLKKNPVLEIPRVTTQIKDNHSGENLWVNFNPLVKFEQVGAPIIGTPGGDMGKHG